MFHFFYNLSQVTRKSVCLFFLPYANNKAVDRPRRNFKTVAGLCSWAGWFESTLVENLKTEIPAFNVDSVNRDKTSRSVSTIEPPHDKTNKMTVRPAKTQFNLGIRPVWS